MESRQIIWQLTVIRFGWRSWCLLVGHVSFISLPLSRHHYTHGTLCSSCLPCAETEQMFKQTASVMAFLVDYFQVAYKTKILYMCMQTTPSSIVITLFCGFCHFIFGIIVSDVQLTLIFSWLSNNVMSI